MTTTPLSRNSSSCCEESKLIGVISCFLFFLAVILKATEFAKMKLSTLNSIEEKIDIKLIPAVESYLLQNDSCIRPSALLFCLYDVIFADIFNIRRTIP
jgi:hypothetical protein